MMRKFMIAFTTFFYTGYFPRGSGTVATAAFVPFYYFLFRTMNPWLYAAITITLYFLGVWASNYAAVIFKDEDPSQVVIDEVVGFLITMFMIPFTWKRTDRGFFHGKDTGYHKTIPGVPGPGIARRQRNNGRRRHIRSPGAGTNVDIDLF